MLSNKIKFNDVDHVPNSEEDDKDYVDLDTVGAGVGMWWQDNTRNDTMDKWYRARNGQTIPRKDKTTNNKTNKGKNKQYEDTMNNKKWYKWNYKRNNKKMKGMIQWWRLTKGTKQAIQWWQKGQRDERNKTSNMMTKGTIRWPTIPTIPMIPKMTKGTKGTKWAIQQWQQKR